MQTTCSPKTKPSPGIGQAESRHSLFLFTYTQCGLPVLPKPNLHRVSVKLKASLAYPFIANSMRTTCSPKTKSSPGIGQAESKLSLFLFAYTQCGLPVLPKPNLHRVSVKLKACLTCCFLYTALYPQPPLQSCIYTKL